MYYTNRQQTMTPQILFDRIFQYGRNMIGLVFGIPDC